jgi:hypothetical protein
MSRIQWQKSSFSEGDGPQCLELAHHDRAIALRESEAPDAILTAAHTRLGALLRSAKSGTFDSLT